MEGTEAGKVVQEFQEAREAKLVTHHNTKRVATTLIHENRAKEMYSAGKV